MLLAVTSLFPSPADEPERIDAVNPFDQYHRKQRLSALGLLVVAFLSSVACVVFLTVLAKAMP